MVSLQKGFLVLALLASVAGGIAGAQSSKVGSLFSGHEQEVKPPATDSLFLTGITPPSSPERTAPVGQMVVDDISDASSVEYSLTATAAPEPHEIIFNKTNSGALLGIAAAFGLAYMLRDRLFPYYR